MKREWHQRDKGAALEATVDVLAVLGLLGLLVFVCILETPDIHPSDAVSSPMVDISDELCFGVWQNSEENTITGQKPTQDAKQAQIFLR